MCERCCLQYSNGRTYFFKADKYYKFDDELLRVAESSTPYPRQTGYWWFGCKQ